jgi:eukaryotic-like serine/threonine-protein kinase
MSGPEPSTQNPVGQQTAPQPAVPETMAWAAPSTPRPPAGTFGRVFGDYELLAEIGRGGMGIVYKARQVDLDRLVALKMILPGDMAGDDDLKRFRIEAEATARLQHPGIVSVHEVGEADGKLYYSMDYIEGPSLAKRLTGGPLTGRVAARYVTAIARAIEHAHRHGILHRDIKPSNILLDRADQPHITDFGLAKKIGGDSKQTRTGAILGTPSYMAPEQAAGKTHEIGPACDVYGLGAMLYELLTGRPPFQTASQLDTIRHVLEREPVPPRLLNPKVDRDLETICLKCLEKAPPNRYATAEAVAQDLDRYLNGSEISARSVNVLDRLVRELDRSQHNEEFGAFGTLAFAFAAIIGMTQVVVFTLTYQGPPYHFFWTSIARVSQFVLMALAYLRFCPTRYLPASAAERQLWSIWIGYFVACIAAVVAGRIMETDEHPLDERALFSVWALFAGMAFFAMGGGYWGRCYAMGAAFFVGGMLTPFVLPWSALIFGGLWVWALSSIGLHLRHLGMQAKSEGSAITNQETEIETGIRHQ